MRDQVVQMGVRSEAIFIESEALHTRENTEHILTILEKTSLHQLTQAVTAAEARRGR